MSAEDLNRALTIACQGCGVACCKKGKFFLPPDEYEAIRSHVTGLGDAALAEFTSRISAHGAFYIYDQKNGCQFLDEHNLCRLHDLGLKPSECFWWPYHIYADKHSGALELRLFMDCCDAHKADDFNGPYHQWIIDEAERIGFDVIRKFREAYCGGQGRMQVIRPVPETRPAS